MKIHIEDYNPKWIDMFNSEKELILSACGDKINSIEHIGSTSVPGLGAKPIIDILLGVKKLKDAEDCITNMESIGYEYVSKYEDVMPERRYFVKRNERTSTHHVHSVEITSEFWNRHLKFRDYLRANDNVRDEYYILKKKLSITDWKDKNDYTDAKTDFIRKIEKEAEIFFCANKNVNV